MNTDEYFYPFDPTGTASTNLVTGERQVINPPGATDFYFIVPKAGPYFRDSLRVVLYPSGRQLIEGVDYNCTHMFHAATHATAKGVYGSIAFYDHTMTGTVGLQYQTIGGDWVIDEATILQVLTNVHIDPRVTTWEQVVDVPYQFPPIAHEYNIDDFIGADDIVDKLMSIRDAIIISGEGQLNVHLADVNNPHQVTKEQVGLGYVDNYLTATASQAQAGAANNAFMTPLRTAQAIQHMAWTRIDDHKVDFNNPHQVTKDQIGLSNVENLPTSSKVEAELGASHARYMTPLRTKEAIAYQIGNAFAAFMARTDNPHQVNKGQVGLGNVENLPVATKVEAETGQSASVYMTAQRTREAILYQAGIVLDEHMLNYGNPHQVTKAQVGLGSVRDLPTADQEIAQAGLSNDHYMTPLMTRYAIQIMADSSVGTHAGLVNNPHQVTAAQVGAYTIAQSNDLLAEKLNIDEAAYDTVRAFGWDINEFTAWVEQFSVDNALKLGGLTISELTTQILSGSAANSLLLAGSTKEEIIAEVLDQVGSTPAEDTFAKQSAVAPLNQVAATDPEGLPVTPTLHWSRLGYVNLPLLPGEFPTDLVLFMSGGKPNTAAVDKGTPIHRVTMMFNNSSVAGVMTFREAIVESLNGVPAEFELYTVPVDNGEDPARIEVWIKDVGLRGGMSVLEMSTRTFEFDLSAAPLTESDLVGSTPTGAVAMTVYSSFKSRVESDAELATVNAEVTELFEEMAEIFSDGALAFAAL